jgi:membrane protease YdiL (CAAX protease family)
MFGGFLFLELACVMAPHVGFFARLEWNWQGKFLETLWVLLLVALPGVSLARLGIRARLEPFSFVPLASVAFLGAGLSLLPWFMGMRMAGDAETVLFELTMPGISEELVWRGVFQSLLNENFGRPWRFAGAAFGWGALLTSALFGIAHGVLVGRNLHLVTSLHGAFFGLLAGAMLAWLRERTGSVWPSMLVHNLVNITPFLATWVIGGH